MAGLVAGIGQFRLANASEIHARHFDLKRNEFVFAVIYRLLKRLLAMAIKPTPEQELFLSLYLDVRKAMRTRNSAEIAARLTADFVSLDAIGNQKTGEQMIAGLLSQPVDPNRQSETRVRSVSITGNLAKVMQTHRSAGRRILPNGKTLFERIEASSSDVWRYEDDRWKLQSTRTLEIRVRAGRMAGAPTP